jgi:hypothetical protein
MTGLGVLFVYLSTIVPTSKIYILGLASCIIPISIMTTNVKNSFLTYAATSLLCLLVVGLKGSTAAYIAFFGLYGFVKYYVERLRNVTLEFVLKLLFFNTSIAVIYLLYSVFFADLMKVNLPLYLLLIAIQFIFIVFDYALTSFIAYFDRRFIKR